MPAPLAASELARLRGWAREEQELWLRALEELVRAESPSRHPEQIAACATICRRWFEEQVGATDGGGAEQPSLLLRAGEGDGPAVLLLGHLDTVWETGDFQPLFGVSEGRAAGPGVFDMKGGVVVALAALAGLRQLRSEPGRVTLLLTPDEEVGSASSRELIESEARRHAAVLVLEPPLGHALKVARKGVGEFRLRLLGRAAHAGLEPEKGVNAVVELAALVGRVAAMARPALGTTVSPTVIRGGTRTNVIAAEAELQVDVRFASAEEATRVEREMQSLTPGHPEARLELSGGSNRPPFETHSSDALFAIAERQAAALGWSRLEGTSAGGGSDGNFTAALGVPTLDGMGIVGGNAHASGEWAELDSIPERAALLAGCLCALWAGEMR